MKNNWSIKDHINHCLAKDAEDKAERKTDHSAKLTFEHPLSHYGIPVLLIDGRSYGPADSIEHTAYAEAGGNAGTAGYFVATRANAGEFEAIAAEAFCAQWPDGPQPDYRPNASTKPIR